MLLQLIPLGIGLMVRLLARLRRRSSRSSRGSRAGGSGLDIAAAVAALLDRQHSGGRRADEQRARLLHKHQIGSGLRNWRN
jgi:hypothetical protein